MKQSSLGFPACDQPSPEKDAAREACDAWVEAWKNILVVVPTTVAGAAALVTFMAEHSHESGGLETPQLTLNELALSLQAFATGAGQDGRHA